MLLSLLICNWNYWEFPTQPRQFHLSTLYSRRGRHHTQQSLTLIGPNSLIRHVIGGPFMCSPRRTATSCNMTVISPSRKWNVHVSGLHLSIKTVSKGLSSLTHLNWEGIKNPCTTDILNDMVICKRPMLTWSWMILTLDDLKIFNPKIATWIFGNRGMQSPWAHISRSIITIYNGSTNCCVASFVGL